MQVEARSEECVVVGFLGKNLTVKSGKGNIVVGQSQALATDEEIISRFVEKTIPSLSALGPAWC
jgi:hypothetical protein